MHDPFDVLGIPSTSDEHALRAAFRALALRHHPDRNPDDPDAGERFKRVMRAYRQALRALRGDRVERAPSGPPPGRWACGDCGDRYVVRSSCPRCGTELEDAGGSEVRCRTNVKVDAWAEALERKAQEKWPRLEALGRHAPALIALTFMLAGALVARIGPLAPAVMFAAFGLWVAVVEIHARVSRDPLLSK